MESPIWSVTISANNAKTTLTPPAPPGQTVHPLPHLSIVARLAFVGTSTNIEAKAKR